MRHKRNDQELAVRRLSSADLEGICGHFRRLDAGSRRARFCGTVSDNGITKYALSIFRYDSLVCGAFIDGQLRGVAELRGVLHFWPSTTEAAFSVEPDWQNIGIGDALFERLISMARNRSVRSIRLMCLKENSLMRHLAVKHNAQLHLDQDAVEAVLYPYWPTPASVAAEFIGETMRITHLFLDERSLVQP
ncbi:GNAT family N-acetyltransferase [Leisingera methylohalidivorans]|uniref:GNAT family N-acetyltransferase n=1 Tax=Leisingera methylohalidivorans TaxID=133924 RepID=UPI0006946112|nr:GNAT family N-acetyltransferase [Leisingera methylohalidivorans]